MFLCAFLKSKFTTRLKCKVINMMIIIKKKQFLTISWQSSLSVIKQTLTQKH